jgi:hypothetical protein
MKRRSWWMCCAATLSIVAGCGNTKTAVVSPSKAQYIARADAICRAHEQKYRAVVMSLFAFKTSWKVAHHEEYAADQRADAQLAAIPMPAGDAEVLLEWLHWLKLATANSVMSADFAAFVKASARAGDLARAYGLTACALRLGERKPLESSETFSAARKG